MHTIIETVSELTVEFIQEALRSPNIEAFEATRIGTGQVGECHRVNLTYAEAATAPNNFPNTIILKIASQDPRSRASGLSLGIYASEVRFYAEIAPSLNAIVKTVAKCYYGVIDESTGAFTLLLEDAGTDAKAGDDIKAATKEEAEVAMYELGMLQAALITDKSNKEWLVREPPISPILLRHLFGSFSTRYKSQMNSQHFDICEKFVASFKGWTDTIKEPGCCTMAITHGDYRLDNMLFMRSPDGSGSSGQLMVVDWQCVTAGPVLGDAAYFLGCSLKTEDRRQWQHELLEKYLQGLEDVAGEPVMSMEECMRELQLNSFFGVIMAIVSSIQAGRSERGDLMFMTILSRHCELVNDLNALTLLKEPEAEDMTPLRPAVEDEKQHSPGAEKNWNESWYFDFIDKGQGVAGWVRMGLTPNRQGNWYQATLTRQGQPTIIMSDFKAPAPDENLKLQSETITATHEVVKPLEEFKLVVNARAHLDTSEGFFDSKQVQQTSLSMDLKFVTDGVPYRYRITTRYEIPCKVAGTIQLEDGSTITLNGVPGQRDHSFGVRDWWSMDWVWAAFHLDNGKHFHSTDLRVPDMPRMGMGYSQQSGTAQEIEELACEEVKDSNSLVTSMDMIIKTSGSDKETRVKVAPVSHTALKLPNPDGRGAALFDRAWATVELEDGEQGVGWFEWNHNPIM